MKKFVVILWVMVTLTLATSTFAAEVEWKTYTDETFGFSIEYPDIYNAGGDPYVNDYGISYFGQYTSGPNGDGEYAFEISGEKTPQEANGDSLLKKETDMEEDEYGYVYGVEPIAGTAKSGPDFYTFDYLDDSAGEEEISHVYCFVGKDVKIRYWIRYPKEDAERFAEITKHMDASINLK